MLIFDDGKVSNAEDGRSLTAMLVDFSGFDFVVADSTIVNISPGRDINDMRTFASPERAIAVLRELAEAIGRGDRVFFMPKE